MRRRIPLIIIGTALLLALALWCLFPRSVPNTDQVRYEQWKRSGTSFGKVIKWQSRLPSGLNRLLGLPSLEKKYIDEYQSLQAELLLSGYLTNVSIAVAVAPTNSLQRSQVASKLRKAFQDRNGWSFHVKSNLIVLTCRPEDEAPSRKALQE